VSTWTTVATINDIAAGDYEVYDLEEARVIVFNLDGEFYALEDLCTHDMSELSGGEFCGEEMTCPRHGALFNIKTGEALTPPAYEPTQTFPVQIVDTLVQVKVERED
jgi:3-phenylpropionate/trans-cinnamate dioxygenase ferredoxin component